MALNAGVNECTALFNVMINYKKAQPRDRSGKIKCVLFSNVHNGVINSSPALEKSSVRATPILTGLFEQVGYRKTSLNIVVDRIRKYNGTPESSCLIFDQENTEIDIAVDLSPLYPELPDISAVHHPVDGQVSELCLLFLTDLAWFIHMR